VFVVLEYQDNRFFINFSVFRKNPRSKLEIQKKYTHSSLFLS